MTGVWTLVSIRILLLPLSIIILLICWKSAKRKPQKGIAGWLLLLCLVLTVLFPAGAISDLLTSYVQIKLDSQELTKFRIFEIIDSMLNIGITLFGIYAGISLWKLKSGAVGLAKKYLIIDLAYSLATCFLPFLAGLPVQIFDTFLNETALFHVTLVIVWYLYLVKSKRVKETFLYVSMMQV
jgi:hypothetical protein